MPRATKPGGCSNAPRTHDLHLALIDLPTDLLRRYAPLLQQNSETTRCLRSVLMKPEHLGWLDRIVDILEASAAEIS